MKTRLSLFTASSLVLAGLLAPLKATAADEEARLQALEAKYEKLLSKYEKVEGELGELKKAKPAPTAAAARSGAKAKVVAAGNATKPAASQDIAEAKSHLIAEPALQADLKDLHTMNGVFTVSEVSDAFAVPNSPAAAVLGVSPDKIQHLTTPKQLVPAVINGLDEHGNFQSGVALDFAPYQWLMGNQPITRFRSGQVGIFGGDDFQSYFERVLLRTQISFATTKGTSNADKSSKLALGIHSVLMNADDPIATADPVRTKEGYVLERKPSDPGVLQPLDAFGHALNHFVLGGGELVSEGSGPLHNLEKALWAHASWSVGAAPEWIAKDEKSSNYRYAGTSAWSSFSYVPTSKMPFQLVLDIMYRSGEQISAEDAIGGDKTAMATTGTAKGKGAATVKQDSLLMIGGVRFGTNDFNATATGAVLELDQHGRGRDQAFRYGLEIEKRISLTTWITLSVSKDMGHEDGDNPALVLGGFKIGFGGRDFRGEDQKARRAEHNLVD